MPKETKELIHKNKLFIQELEAIAIQAGRVDAATEILRVLSGPTKLSQNEMRLGSNYLKSLMQGKKEQNAKLAQPGDDTGSLMSMVTQLDEPLREFKDFIDRLYLSRKEQGWDEAVDAVCEKFGEKGPCVEDFARIFLDVLGIINETSAMVGKVGDKQAQVSPLNLLIH